jgi:decaprenylphospho-beta-D-erythro-pentofuranosid-2-ulose 2-reductase
LAAGGDVTDRRRIWILGATSAIAQAYARRRAARGTHLLLLGRNEDHLRANAADLIARGATATLQCRDLARIANYSAAIADMIGAGGAPDEVLIAYGTMRPSSEPLSDPAAARDLIDTNFTSVVCWLLAIIDRWEHARPLTLIVIGSVAGDRGRASNFVYGSAKGGLDRFLEGLQHAHATTPLRIIRVKPGFVDTPMTAGIAKSGPLWATPERVAADIERAAGRAQAVVYTPWFWRPIMLIIRHLPRFIFDRLKI